MRPRLQPAADEDEVTVVPMPMSEALRAEAAAPAAAVPKASTETRFVYLCEHGRHRSVAISRAICDTLHHYEIRCEHTSVMHQLD